MQSIINTIASFQITDAVFQTILHSLWQIPVIALAIKLLVAKKNRKSTKSSYNSNFSAILISLIASGFTLTYYLLKNISAASDQAIVGELSVEGLLGAEGLTALELPLTTFSMTEWLSQYHSVVVIIWALGVSLLLSRIISGWLGINMIKKSLSYKIPDHITSSFENLKYELGISPNIKLALSDVISVPMIIGHLKPIVLIPIATLNHLNTEELESILIHELTHILQDDYLKNIIVMIAESVFFYHPIIWMLSSEIKEEREHICDEAVMNIYPNRIQYAKTLVKLEEVFHGNESRLSLALFTNKFKLMKRVKRILNMHTNSSPARARIAAVAVLMVGLVFVSSADAIIKSPRIDTSWIPGIPAPPAPPSPPVWVGEDGPPAPPAPPVPPAAPEMAAPPAPPAPPSPPDMVPPPAPPAPPIPPHMAAPPAPPVPPIPPVTPSFDGSSFIDFGFINSRIDTLDPEKRKRLKKELSEKREELREIRKKIKEEYKSDLKEKKQELKELRKKLEDDDQSTYIYLDRDELDTEELEEFAENMSEWGERFGERIASQFDEEWVDKMEAWGEEFGEKFGENFGEEWAEGFEEMGEGFAEIFDEEWVEGIEEMAEGVTEVFDEEWMEEIEELSIAAAEMAEEVAAEFEEEFENEDHFYSKRSNRSTKSNLLSALRSDNLLNDGKNKITINDDEMKVNGQKMSDAQLKKYQRIITRGNRNAFVNGKTKVEFSINGTDDTDSKSSLSISVDY